MEKNLDKLVESLSPIERKIVPFIGEKDIDVLIEKSKLDKVSVLRALEFLNSKKIIDLNIEKKKIVELGTNGIYYVRKGLPERQLIHLLEQGNFSIQEAEKKSKLTKNEFKAALGALKKKALLDIKNGTLILTGNKEEITKKSLEEQILEKLPKPLEELEAEEKFAFESLKERKDIVYIEERQVVNYEITNLGKELGKKDLTYTENLVEEITSEMIQKGSWKGKKFRRYDVVSPVPKISGGKKHFVNQAIDYGRKIWTEMGFEEMTGNFVQSSFWNFDALFTAQDHPVRELQDTFFIKDLEANLPEKKVVNEVKKAHESGVGGSKGWGYKWSEENAKKVLIRTHTTCLSAQTLYNLKKEDIPKKFFAIGKNFRNETVDWSHGFEFNQTEGIVVDPNANLRQLFGYLKEFAKKMGYEKVRFQPAYFPYTEPSVEGVVWNEKKQEWVEMIAAGIFRPEVTKPLLGISMPVLAWGPGFDRMMMGIYQINDLRKLYENDIKQLREIKFWSK